MTLRIEKTELDGVLMIHPPTQFEDFRGDYIETYNEQLYRDAGITDHFVQDDCSMSTRHVLRGIVGGSDGKPDDDDEQRRLQRQIAKSLRKTPAWSRHIGPRNISHGPARGGGNTQSSDVTFSERADRIAGRPWSTAR